MHWYLRFKIVLSDTKNITFLVNTNHKNVSHIYYTNTHICGKKQYFSQKNQLFNFQPVPKMFVPL